MYFLLNMGIFHCYVSLPEGDTLYDCDILFFAKQHLEADFGMWSVAGCQTGPCQQKRNCLYLCSMYALNIHSIY